jgi:TetR/AcrR family transcriptional repressor of nem operon
MAATLDTSQRILDIAERLVQTRGFNGFSYADIAEAMKVTKASLHYHFRSKAELGARLIERYEKNFLAALAAIDAQTDVAAEYGTRPDEMRDFLRHFFDANERWLVGVLKDGKRAKRLTFKGTPAEAAQALVGSLEGAMMIARSYGDPGRFEAVCERLLADLGA